ncbi:MAG: S8 family serine peptidase [Microthrixaceae bacterium]|nr:S8 family serine peptidase [Microthrixaceae bacterium]
MWISRTPCTRAAAWRSTPTGVATGSTSVTSSTRGCGETGSGHGTHVAGLIGAERDNAAAGRGLAAGARMLLLEVLDGGLSEAVYLATDAGSRVINLSVSTNADCRGTPESNQLDEWAIRYAVDHRRSGRRVCGNCGAASFEEDGCRRRDQKQYPAAYDGVIAVGAVDHEGEVASFSSKNEYVDLAAPGGEFTKECVLSTKASASVEPDPDKRHDGRPRGDEMVAMCGTSMAAPLVSATAALVVAKNPALTVQEVTEILVSTTMGQGSKRHWTSGRGWGSWIRLPRWSWQAVPDTAHRRPPRRNVPQPSPRQSSRRSTRLRSATGSKASSRWRTTSSSRDGSECGTTARSIPP